MKKQAGKIKKGDTIKVLPKYMKVLSVSQEDTAKNCIHLRLEIDEYMHMSVILPKRAFFKVKK